MDDLTKPETALDRPEAKIWRYIDLNRFASVLGRRALYFARPSEFHDPYEGWLPRSHLEAFAKMNQGFIDQQNALRKQVEEMNPGANLENFHKGIDASLVRYAKLAKEAHLNAAQRFGINCWHKNEYESEAMWRTYPADSVAIESTVGRLLEAHRGEKKLLIDDVRYADFDHDPIEKGHRENLLFLKRKSFEHERELRATVLLGDGDKGSLLNFDLDVLVTKIHVSPRASKMFCQTISDLCNGDFPKLNKPILVSALYEKPNYGIELNLSR